jgi:hypothetical protein
MNSHFAQLRSWYVLCRHYLGWTPHDANRPCRPFLETLEDRDLRTAIYGVGPGHQYAELWQVPWGSLARGDQVQVYWQAQPYHSKIGVNTSGISIIGIAGPNGQLPVIDGNRAQENLDAGYWTDEIAAEGVITVAPATYAGGMVSDVLIQGLELKDANENSYFFDAHGKLQWYNNAAAGVAIYRAANVTIDNCNIHDNDNGIFGKSYGYAGWDLYNVVVSANDIWGNGLVGSAGRHNTYIEGWYTLYIGNHYGPLRAGADGMNLKDRSVCPTIAYNYIENGARLLELVDPDDGATDMVTSPEYGTEWVNVLVNHGQARGAVHFGFDQVGANTQKVLYFYNNTVITENTYENGTGWYYTELLKLNNATAYVFDNVVSLYSPTGGWPGVFFLAVTEYGPANVVYGVNVVPVGAYVDDIDLTAYGAQNLIFSDAGFVDLAGGDYRLTPDSPAIGIASGLFDGARFVSFADADMPAVTYQYDFADGGGWLARATVSNLGTWEGDPFVLDPELVKGRRN